ncbi:MAG: DUF4129 domain-containing protein, partial [Magnetococcales bacterium]|nr:DUF4129 domain-containing protein [Magnetococcales bacterium]
YDHLRQKKLLKNLGLAARLLDQVALLAGGILLLLAVVAVIVLKPFRTRNRDPITRGYERFCTLLASQGVVRHPAEGPSDYANRAITKIPQARHEIRMVLNLYLQSRYGDGTPPVDPASFTTALRQLKQVLNGRTPER